MNSPDGHPLYKYEVPLVQDHGGWRLRFYYTFHPDAKPKSWKTPTDHRVQFRAFALASDQWEFFLDHHLWSMGFIIQTNIIHRILIDHHCNAKHNPKQTP